MCLVLVAFNALDFYARTTEGTDLVTGKGWTLDTTPAAGDLAVIRER